MLSHRSDPGPVGGGGGGGGDGGGGGGVMVPVFKLDLRGVLWTGQSVSRGR